MGIRRRRRTFIPGRRLAARSPPGSIPMLGRRQELNLQFQQITDGLLMSVAFWLAHTLRFIGAIFDKPIGPFADFQWLLFVIMPLGPIILEMQGFYLHPGQKTLAKSLQQLARAAFWLGLLIAGLSLIHI